MLAHRVSALAAHVVLVERQAVDAQVIAEGIFAGHPDMPIFVFGPYDVEAIIDYLESIQEQ